MSLFPLNREEDKEVLRKVFGDIPNLDRPNSYFACPHYFKVFTQTGKYGLSRKIVMSLEETRQGALAPDKSAYNGAELLKKNLFPILNSQSKTLYYPGGNFKTQKGSFRSCSTRISLLYTCYLPK